MALWQTKNQVYCEVDALNYDESWRMDANSTTVPITIPWSKREQFLKDMLGYHKRNGEPNGLITRSLPETCPGVDSFSVGPKQYCVSCDLVGLTGVNDDHPTTGSVTGATNATPIVITAAGHGLLDTIFPATDSYYENPAMGHGTVTISGVGGNTAANGTWAFKKVSDDTFQLIGSAGNGNYTTGGTFSSSSVAGRDKWLNFARAKYRCVFQALPYLIDYDVSSKTDERWRYVYRRQRFISREQKIPGGGFKFTGSGDKIAEVGFRISTEVELQYTWYSVPVTAMPWTYFVAYVGRVNQAEWRDENQPLSNTYAAQTLLFKGVEEKRYFDANGTLLADLTYLFGYRPQTWNTFPDRRGVFAQIETDPGGLPLYPYTTEAAANVDFTNLFKAA